MSKSKTNKVYFIQDTNTGFVKIGKSNNPRGRMKSFQTGSASKLVIRKVIDGGLYLERILHIYFSKLRKRGEWFKPDYELGMFINNKRPIAINSIETYLIESNVPIKKNLRVYLSNLNKIRHYL